MGRKLMLLLLFLNLLLCFYIGYQLFRTVESLQNVAKLLAQAIANPPDFSGLRALAVYVVLFGISGFALAYWVYEDGSNIQKLMSLRKPSAQTRKQEYKAKLESGKIVLLECPKCGEELSKDFELCPSCGYELKLITCARCGKEISRKFNLCPYCGNKLENAS